MAVWNSRANQVFLEAAEVESPAERQRLLDQECGDDTGLRAQVESLLAASAKMGSFLNKPAAQTMPGNCDTATYEHIAECPDTVIGPYKLIEPIGEGGMGTVWMAQQTEPVKRLVAIKFIKAGMDSRQVIARFEAERQALALMDHPHIAKILDAGTTAEVAGGGWRVAREEGMDSPATRHPPLATSSGRPYFVMDLVKGVPITRYCDEHRLTPRQRLELFLPVCQAVQHAHQKGIIHRDIKPSNVLVALSDGKPAPKVIDFGVAKATGPSLTDKTLVTGFGAIVGTLEYMSPEQAEVHQLDIDTRSDIYSLGVLLYELLTGSPPFSRQELTQAGVLEMLRVIREEEPSRPSTKLSTAEGLPTLAANRGTEPARLTKLVRGELDWIVMKALEKDRGRRYETANAFAMDVQRYLAGEPVQAAPASRWYRLRKFVRKHRGPVVAAGLVLLALVGGIAGTTWGLLRAVDERDAKDGALKAEQRARADETKAREQAFAALRSMTTEVIERKFTQSTVLTADDRAFLRGVIKQFDAFAAIKGDDAESRWARAEGRFLIANIRRTLVELKEAEQDYGEALRIFKQLAADFPNRTEYRRELAKALNNRGILLSGTGRPHEAEKDFDQARRIFKQLAADFPNRPEFRQELATSHTNRGSLLLTATDRLQDSEKDYGEARRIFKQLAADFPDRTEYRRDLAKSLTNRGNLLYARGRPQEAVKDYDQALCIIKQLAADFPARPEYRQDLANGHNNRGALLFHTTSRPKDAEKDYEQALSIYKQLAADFPSRPEFRQNLANSHINRGNLLYTTGRLKAAEQDYDQALSIYKQLAADFPSRPQFRRELANCYKSRGDVLRETGRLKKATQGYDQALSIQKQLVADSPNQPDLRNDLAATCTSLAIMHCQQGNWAAAKRFLLEARPHHLAALKANPRHPTYRQFYRNHLGLLTEVHAGLLEPEEAVQTAKTRRDLGWNPPADAYDAAGVLSWCIRSVAKHDKLDDKQRKEATEFYGAAAMKILRDAVRKGYKDVAHMKKDTDLEPLRQRVDFQKLVAQLEGTGK
jgi:serine/threonine protein kinase/tetratricopeptide (TPR) repeat protein